MVSSDVPTKFPARARFPVPSFKVAASTSKTTMGFPSVGAVIVSIATAPEIGSFHFYGASAISVTSQPVMFIVIV